MERVAGIQTGGSERAFDVYMKARYLHEQHPGHGVTFATGTPISNTMMEMYTMQRFLDPEGLKSRGLEHFDAWAATFGEVIDTMEISPDGAGLRPRSRFARFTNLPELQQMFRAFSDVQTAEMLDLPRPGLESGKPIVVACPMSDEQHALQQELVERYERLVRSCVRQYRGSPEPVEDLMQVGYVGLLKAINNFDPAFGNSLTAYAAPCVSGEIKRHFRDKRWQVHVRRAAQELLLEMRKATEELTHTLGRQPTNEELAERLGVSADDLLEAQQADMVFTSYSLDAPLSDGDDPGQLADMLGDEDADVERAIDMEAVATHWDELPEREQKILTMRFYGNLTQAEIGATLGISQMHVSRLLTRALAHLRSRLLDAAA